jgi:hypothetical protein
MKGIGRRVTIGFLSIVALLFASGVISLFELSNLSNDTEVILAASRRNMELAKDMLKSAHEHSQAVLHVALFDEFSQRDACRRAMGDLDGKIAAARSEAIDASKLDSLLLSVAQLREVTEQFVFTQNPSAVQLQTIGIAEAIEDEELVALRGKMWYDEHYKPAYDELVDEVQNFMTHTHSSLAPRAEQLNKNAYRSVAPVFISLVVMIAIVLMFYYFIRIYCVKPIEKINGSLSNYLSYRLPFGVKGDLLDELKELTDNIERLIGLSKQNRQ